MNLSAPFIHRPIMTTLVMIAILALGIAAFIQIPVSNLPDINYPTILVQTSFPGANPTIMANTVATPLEKQFMTIPGIKYVTSNSTLGSTSIILTFETSKDIDLAAVDVDAAIILAKPNLPPNLPQDPSYRKVNPSSTPILYIVLTSASMTQGQMYDYANTFVGQRLTTIEGVSQVQVLGSPKAVRAQIDPALVASLGLSMQDIGEAINAGNQYQPLGIFDGDYTAPVIYDNGSLPNAAAYEPLIIAYRNGSPIRLEELGVVVDSTQNDRQTRLFLRNDVVQRSITLAVQTQPGANVVNAAKAIKRMIPLLSKQLPGSLDLIVVFDRSLSIIESIKEVELTLVIAFCLVVLVIFVYLGRIRDTIIPSLAMPMSIIATFAVIYQLGFTLDNLSLLALTLSIGFIIDDAIVVLENIVRRHENGESLLEASLNGSQQISFTIVSMTLSLVAVFIPLIFMAGIIGKIFQEFAITLAIVTLLSGIISLTLTPMLCSRFIAPHQADNKSKLSKISDNLNAWLLKHYEKGLKWVLHHRKTMLGVGVLSVLISFLFFKILPTDFIPDEDIGFLMAFTEAAQGTSSDQMRRYHIDIINALKNEPSIHSIVSISSNPSYRQGLVFITLVPRAQRPSMKELMQQFNQKLRLIPGVNVFLKNIPLIDLNIGTQVRGAYQYLMQGLDSDLLYDSAQKLIEAMNKDSLFQGISTDLEIKTPQLNLEINRDQAYALGVDVDNFERSLLLSYSGNRVSRIQTPIDQYDVILEMNRDLQRDPSSLDYLYMRSNTNKLVPMNAIATWKEGVGPASINHFAQFPAVTITFNIEPESPLSTALDRLRTLAEEHVNPKITGDVKGAAESFEESIDSIAFLLLVTIFAIYIVLGILYESFIHPITILSTLPPAILGALLTLFILGKPLSLYAYLGIILLIGIVKKNGIMVVDFALENIRLKGEDAEKSIYDACIVRFRPIMMTTVAAIMGAVPIALGNESRRPFGYVIIGGMLVSQMITLFLTPVIYLYMEQFRERFNKK